MDIAESILNLSLESIDDPTEELWKTLLNHLNCSHLDTLHNYFVTEKQLSGLEYIDIESIKKEEFVTAIDDTLGIGKFSFEAVSLFNEIDSEKEEKITWKQFLEFILKHSGHVKDRYECSVYKYRSIEHTKRQSIKKIVIIETSTTFCYVVMTYYGRIGIYDGNMSLLFQYDAMLDEIRAKELAPPKRSRSKWITDAVYLPDCKILAIATSARCLILYDASRLLHNPVWFISGIPNAPERLAYHADKTSYLLMGDSEGFFIYLNFLQPKVDLLPKKYSDKLSCYYWMEVINFASHVIISTPVKIHYDKIESLYYRPDNETVISCSKDPNTSLVIYHLNCRRIPYIFKVERVGINCFKVDKKYSMIVTGSEDHILRIWNPVVKKQPIVCFKGHKAGIIDLCLIIDKDLILSFSKDAVLKTWDLVEHTCLQTIKMKFPVLSILGKIIEWGVDSIYPGPTRVSSAQNVQTKRSTGDEINTGIPSIHLEDEDICISSSPRLNRLLKSPDPWSSTTINITCCNEIACILVELQTKSIENIFTLDEAKVLSPPPFQNELLVPNSWRESDKELKLKAYEQNMFPLETDNLNEKFDEVINKHDLDHIVNKTFISPDKKSNIHNRLTQIDVMKRDMQLPVSQCAPHLALTLWDLKPLAFSKEMPLPTNKRLGRIVGKTHRLLTSSTVESLLTDRSSYSKSSQSLHSQNT